MYRREGESNKEGGKEGRMGRMMVGVEGVRDGEVERK